MMMTMMTTMTTMNKNGQNMAAPARLNLETINTLVEHQLSLWPDAKKRYDDLARSLRKPLDAGDLPMALQLNPARIVSTGADISNEGIAKRPCFLCASNRPKEQLSAEWMPGWELCVNPFPILPIHFTIISTEHRPQDEPPFEMAAMAEAAPDLAIFFNGAHGGASAPDHLHLQAVLKSELPLLRVAEQHHPSDRPGFMSSEEFGINLPFQFISVVITPDLEGARILMKIPGAFGIDPDGNRDKGLINVFFWIGDDRLLRAVIVPRLSHRPHHYFLEGDDRIVVAPGAIDMTGLMITPRREDYDRIDSATMRQIYAEVAFADRLPDEIKRYFEI